MILKDFSRVFHWKMACSFYSKFIWIKDEQRRARRVLNFYSSKVRSKQTWLSDTLILIQQGKEIILRIKFYIMDYYYKLLTIYKTFFIDIVSSQSFPLFVIYLIFTSNCYRWKKIAGPIHFQKVFSSQYLDSFIRMISMIDTMNNYKGTHYLCLTNSSRNHLLHLCFFFSRC